MRSRPARRRQNRLRASQVRLTRMFLAGFLREGDVLSVNIDGTIYDFTIGSQRSITFRMPNGEDMRLLRGGGPFSLLLGAGLAVPAHVNWGIWDHFLVYRGEQHLGTLNEIRQEFWNASESNRLRLAGRAAAAPT